LRHPSRIGVNYLTQKEFRTYGYYFRVHVINLLSGTGKGRLPHLGGQEPLSTHGHRRV